MVPLGWRCCCSQEVRELGESKEQVDTSEMGKFGLSTAVLFCHLPFNSKRNLCFPFSLFLQESPLLLLIFRIFVHLGRKNDGKGLIFPQSRADVQPKMAQPPLLSRAKDCKLWQQEGHGGLQWCVPTQPCHATLALGTLGSCRGSRLVLGLVLPHHPGGSLPVMPTSPGACSGLGSQLFIPASSLPLPQVPSLALGKRNLLLEP